MSKVTLLTMKDGQDRALPRSNEPHSWSDAAFDGPKRLSECRMDDMEQAAEMERILMITEGRKNDQSG